MAGPWEKYAPKAEGDGPWSKYGKAATPAPAAAGPSDYSQSHVGQGAYGMNEGLAGALGFPVDAINSALGVVGMGSEKPFLGSKQITEMMTGAGAIKPPTDDGTKQFARRVGQSVGSTIPFALGGAAGAKSVADAAKVIGGTMISGAAGGVGGAAAQQIAPGNELAEFAGEMIGGLAPVGVASLMRRGKAAVTAPSVKDLQDEAGKLYDQAENSGVTFQQPVVKLKVDDITARAMSEGIDPTIHPSATAALKRLQDASTRGLTVKEARTLRRVIAAAEKDFSNGDQVRIAGIMRRQFDELLNTVPELAPANALYTRAAKGDLIDTARELAASKAGQFSGSGFENALRTEFRALERQIIKGQLKGLTPAEEAAIRRVAQGGHIDAVMRGVGKLAPTGVVSFAGSGGVPFLVGNAVGGPAVGAAFAGATMGAGVTGRAVATAMQKRNAAVASALARRGAPANKGPILSAIEKRIAAATAAGAASN